ncbi:MAG: hypothetical protein BWY52_00684 [Chloroflexi bacterium ADurb.Bin325]|nr:MAG: hypothetical protein BWY52_00684 [Chloroflexi bacterium ADurb.Bin325]
MTDRRIIEKARIVRHRGSVVAAGERIGYTLRSCDARSEAERAADRARRALSGALIVVLPGHGQTASSSTLLLAEAALRGRAGVAWLIDLDPPAGGDPIRAQALPVVIGRHWAGLAAGDAPPPGGVVLAGWSHGGGRSLRRGPRAVWQALYVGADIVVGIGSDLVHTRSVRRVVADVLWATARVPGPAYPYPGDVALVFGADDTVIRWRMVFPDCAAAAEIPAALAAYRRTNFPHVSSLTVRVLPGDHLSPGVDRAFARTMLALSGQLLAPDGASKG